MEVLLVTSAATHVEVEVLASAATSATTKEVCKNIIHVHAIESTATTLAVSLLMLSHTLFSLQIVDTTLLFIAKGLIGIGNLLELCLGSLRVVLVLIRMVLDSQLLECLLNLSVSRVAFDTQQFVVVL